MTSVCLLRGLLLCSALAGSCAPPARLGPTPSQRVGPVAKAVRVYGANGVTVLRVVPGQLVRLGDEGPFYYAYRGEPELRTRRSARIVQLNERALGLDITGLEDEQAAALIGRQRSAEVVIWREVTRLSPRVVAALSRLTSRRLVLVIGQRLDARGGVGLARLRPLGDRLYGLVLECELDASELRGLAALSRLRALRIPAALDGSTVAGLSSLRQLRHLQLPGTLRSFGVGGAALEHLARLGSLQTLDLSGNGLDDASLARLPPLQRLRWLNLRGNAVTAEGVRRLRAARPGCRVEEGPRSAPAARPAVAVESIPPRRAIGLSPCDAYLRLIRCYAQVQSPSSRQRMLRAVDRIAKRWKRFLGRSGTGGSSRAAVRKTCQRGFQMLRRLVSRQTTARHCLTGSR
ncbi:MAG: hypothetical protein ABI333_07530 [bacterium]